MKDKLLFIPFKIFKKCSIPFKLWILSLIVKKFLCWKNGVLQQTQAIYIGSSHNMSIPILLHFYGISL